MTFDQIQQVALEVIDSQLGLGGAALNFSADSRLHGYLPQFDSMAVVGIIAGLESRLNFDFPETELEGSVFETVGSLVRTVAHVLENTK